MTNLTLSHSLITLFVQVSEECMWSHLLPDPLTFPTAAAAATTASSSSSATKREDQDRHAMDVDAGGSSAGSGAPPVDVITNRWILS